MKHDYKAQQIAVYKRIQAKNEILRKNEQKRLLIIIGLFFTLAAFLIVCF